MSGDEVARRQLAERLLDDVELPAGLDREAMFERTFASPPGAGQDLLPPEGFFDPDEPVADESDVDIDAGVADPFTDDVAAQPGEQAGHELGPHPGHGGDHDTDHHGPDHADTDHGDGLDPTHPASDW